MENTMNMLNKIHPAIFARLAHYIIEPWHNYWDNRKENKC